MLSYYFFLSVLLSILMIGFGSFALQDIIYNRPSVSVIITYMFVALVLLYTYKALFYTDHTEKIEEYCNIVEEKQLEDYTISKVELPENDYEWIIIRNEPVSDDGEKVLLQLEQDYNRYGNVIRQTVMNTALYTGKVEE